MVANWSPSPSADDSDGAPSPFGDYSGGATVANWTPFPFADDSDDDLSPFADYSGGAAVARCSQQTFLEEAASTEVTTRRKRQAQTPSGTTSLIAKLQLRQLSAGARSQTCAVLEVERRCPDCLRLSVEIERRAHQ